MFVRLPITGVGIDVGGTKALGVAISSSGELLAEERGDLVGTHRCDGHTVAKLNEAEKSKKLITQRPFFSVSTW